MHKAGAAPGVAPEWGLFEIQHTHLNMTCFSTRPLVLATLLVIPLLSASAAEVVSLSGNWEFALDPEDQGITAGWSAPSMVLPDKIKLPGTTDEAGYGTPTLKADTGVLTRRVKYYGPAWYQRTIHVPEAWQQKEVELFLERVLWESRVWVDGRFCDAQDSLNTPHRHQLGTLAPGSHVLTVRIDNRPLCPLGLNGHSYTEQTQTIWNGAVGRIELLAHDPIAVGSLRVFPDAAAARVQGEIMVCSPASGPQPATATWRVRHKGSRKVVAEEHGQFVVQPGTNTVRQDVIFAQPPAQWDEFSPNLYTLEVTVKSGGSTDHAESVFGFRQVSRIGQQIALNGRPVFMRGNLDCVHFPLTGYPDMGVADWKRILGIYRDYGLNHIRFHTWTPPEAAFTAADELGIYIQCEVVWVQRHLGKDQPGRMETMNSGSFPESLMTPPGTVDGYVHDEIRRVVDAYGNHPSFVLFTIGNELGSYDPEECGRWIEEIKAHDPRRFYAVSTARRIVPQDDFNATHAIPGIGWCRDRLEPFNDWDYEKLYEQAPVPIIAHEVGQWPTFPVWKEIKKYKGVLRAWNLEHFRELAVSNGVAQLDEEFRSASGAIGQRLYKDEIESHLRTPACAGFQLLSMQDFSGQGEALVGWLDSFYDSKGVVTPKRFRRWCSETVPLARLPKYIFESGDTLSATLEVAHYGAEPLGDATAVWSLRDEHGKLLEQGELPPVSVPVSGVTKLGSITAKLSPRALPCRARLEVRLQGTPFANDWDVWIFPPKDPDAAAQGEVILCDTFDEALTNLQRGHKVLLDAHRLGTKENARYARFKPVYWSAAMFSGQYTLGALVREKHAALRQFPTDNHLDWQWEDLCRNARGFRLEGLPLDYQPIVQPICDFHFNWKLGAIFELKVGEGKLLVCGYDAFTRLDQRPAARQLRASLLAYMNSPAFAPRTTANPELLARMFPEVRMAPVAMPRDFKEAVLFVKAGAKDPTPGNVPWTTELDEVQVTEAGFGYAVECNAVWKDNSGTAWWGSPKLQIEVRIPTANVYDFYVHFHDWNRNSREGKIKFEGREYELGPHAGDGKWVKLEVLREDCLDGKIVLEAEPTSGPNLQVTGVALVPR